MSKKLQEYFNKTPRMATLSTADKEGKVDAAYFGSPWMVDDTTVAMALMNGRTFKNLQENPHAVFTIVEPGDTMAEWKGLRVYLRMTGCDTEGEKLEAARASIREKAGEETARLIHAAVEFGIYEIRPLADFGQGWQNSI